MLTDENEIYAVTPRNDNYYDEDNDDSIIITEILVIARYA